jgi:hypothetical protein
MTRVPTIAVPRRDCEIMSPSAAIRKVTANGASYLPPFGRQGDELSPFPWLAPMVYPLIIILAPFVW